LIVHPVVLLRRAVRRGGGGGRLSWADVATPLSPATPLCPVPTNVRMMPVDRVTRLLLPSAMYTLPDTSTARVLGALSCASVAGPLSPPNPATPVPAIVEMIPVRLLLMNRTRFSASTGCRVRKTVCDLVTN